MPRVDMGERPAASSGRISAHTGRTGGWVNPPRLGIAEKHLGHCRELNSDRQAETTHLTINRGTR
jgi:hypothetical protein